MPGSNARRIRIWAATLVAVAAAQPAAAQPGWVLSHQKIIDTEGGFTGTLDDFDSFGSSVATLGDLDGDRVGDLAMGASQDGDGGFRRGDVWVLFLNTNGTVKSRSVRVGVGCERFAMHFCRRNPNSLQGEAR